MEQPALLTVIRTETAYRFRLDLPDDPALLGQEYVTELTTEIRERLRRLLQAAAQYMQSAAFVDAKHQTLKLSAANDSIPNLGRYLFNTLLPAPMQEALRYLDTPLVLSTNTPDIPWELLFDGNIRSGHFLAQQISISRQVNGDREAVATNRLPILERSARKMGRREASGLSILFLVNPTGERPVGGRRGRGPLYDAARIRLAHYSLPAAGQSIGDADAYQHRRAPSNTLCRTAAGCRSRRNALAGTGRKLAPG